MSVTLSASRRNVWDREILLQEGLRIAGEIRDRRVLTPKGYSTWVGPAGYGTELHPLVSKKLGPHLYDGITGVSLFFAAVALVTGDGSFRRDALNALLPLRKKIEDLVLDPEKASKLHLQIGGLMGVSSWIYAFLKIGEWLDDAELIAEAHRATNLLSPERIALDDLVRIQTGAAGALLVLLALHRRVPDANARGATPLEIARECGQQLLIQQVSFDGFPPAWSLSPGKPPLVGFSYGAAGICYALLRLDEASPDPDIRKAALDGLSFIDGLYSAEKRSWQDVRSIFEARYEAPSRGTWRDWWASGKFEELVPRKPEQQLGPVGSEFPASWCHGAPGIALGRLVALDLAGRPHDRERVEAVLDQIATVAKRTGSSGPDDICCGHMGRVEVLLAAAQNQACQRWEEAALTLAGKIVQRAREGGGYQVSAARGSRHFAPALFQGLSGVGYGLLRLARPEALPCLLLLD
jgi:lantibiotic modifying enzyme